MNDRYETEYEVTTIKWLIGLAAIAALAWLASDMDDVGTRTSMVDSPSAQTLPRTEMPAIGLNRLLSVAEIRWCLSQRIRLDTIEPTLVAHRAIDRYNELADDYNRRCNGQEYSRADAEEATRSIDPVRRLIAEAALEDIRQLDDEGLTRQIQALLARLGYNPGAVDGAYGAQTRTAIEAFQRDTENEVNGLLSDELLDRLRLEHRMRLASAEEAAAVELAEAADVAETDERAGTATVVVNVTEKPDDAVADPADAAPVANAAVKISGENGFEEDQLTNERGRAEFTAIPTGRINVDVQRDTERSRVALQVTDSPNQEIWITLPRPAR